jgi:hypothetical protein
LQPGNAAQQKSQTTKIAKQSSTKRAGVKFPTVAIDFFFT